jgi:translation initiation factor IF-3
LNTNEAIRKAEEKGLDLVEVAPGSSPPVCRIMDYSRYKYEQEKRARAARKKHRIFHIKEVRFKTKIEEHDYQVKLRKITEFLEHFDKVKIRVYFRGREITHPEFGNKLIERLINDVSDIAFPEKPPEQEGRFITMVLAPKTREIKRKKKEVSNAEDENE